MGQEQFPVALVFLKRRLALLGSIRQKEVKPVYALNHKDLKHL